MQLVDGNYKFSFNYTAYDQASNLFVQAKIYDVSTGTAVFVTTVTMAHVLNGAYWGGYTGTAGKTYLVIMLVYTTSGYVTVDADRAPGAEVFQAVDDGLYFCGFNYAAADLSETLYVAANIYDVTSGASFVSQLAMAHVANGVYFGSFTPTVNKTYVIEKSVYQANDYADTDADRSPGCDNFQSFDISGSGIVVNNVMTSAVLIGQSTEAILEAT